MKRHLTLTTTSQYASGHGQIAEASAIGLQASDRLIDLPFGGTAYAEEAQPHPPGWRHTLILVGSLDDGSAAELEDEIECLREEGVTALTLDLRRLDEIDSPGAHLIATQGAHFEEGGRSFAVIPPGLLGQGLLAQVPVGDLLVHASPEGFVPRFASPHVPGDVPDRSTTTIKELVPQSAEGA
jgi:ABC-type transporter Mla MlaB component